MRRLIQHAAGCGLSAFVLAALVQLPTEVPANDKAPATDPKSYTETIPGTTVQFDMVAIPGGTFTMGSPANEKGHQDNEGPQHPVTIRPLWVAKCQITWDEFNIYRKELGVDNVDEYEKIIKNDPTAITGPTPPYVPETYGHKREGHPALCMTWHAAMEYCRWLSKKTGKVYRLPTEAEWEYAARAGTKTAYFFGDDPKDLKQYAWYADNSEETTHPVGSKKPNPWGLHDMGGNVMEWCIDEYKKDAYTMFPLDKPTVGPVLLPGINRYPHVARGGSWADQAEQLRCAVRRGSEKSWSKRDPQRPQSIWWHTEWDVVGFRIVRAVDEQENLKGLRSRITRQSP
jgi:formylglycine-generating enzyme required for sulfatase activity